MDVETLLSWAKVILSGAITVILVPLVIYSVRYYWDRRRWHAFEELIRGWADEEFFVEDMTDEDWNVLAAMKLNDAGFEPAKIKELIELAVWFAKGRVSQEMTGRITVGKEDKDNGRREQAR